MKINSKIENDTHSQKRYEIWCVVYTPNFENFGGKENINKSSILEHVAKRFKSTNLKRFQKIHTTMKNIVAFLFITITFKDGENYHYLCFGFFFFFSFKFYFLNLRKIKIFLRVY